jgi:uncharacterized protein (DUF433 family)
MGNQTQFNFRQYLTRRKDIMGGETVFKGTRVPLRTILGSLADGDTPEQLLKSFPALTPDHLRAAIAFAADAARDDLPYLDSPAAA